MKKRVRKPTLTPLQELADQAMQAAARKVRAENKRLGEPLIIAVNGKLKRIPASEL